MSDFDFDEDDVTPEGEESRRIFRRRLFTYTTDALKIGLAAERVYVNHSACRTALEAFDRLLQLSTASTIPNGVTLIGGPGTGKSSLMQLHRSTLPPSDSFDAGDGILFVRLQEKPSIGRVVSTLLRRLNYPFSHVSKNAVSLKRDIVVDAIRQKKSRVLMVDEAHHIIRGRRADREAQGTCEISEFFRELIDECRIGLVLAGTDALDKLAVIDPHLHSRVATRIELKNFQDNKEWLGFVRSFCTQVKDIDLTTLSKPEVSKLMMTASRGNPRAFKRLVVEAILIASDAGRAHIDHADLGLAFDRIYGKDGQSTNPFAKDSGP